jgi:hypothetical protein
VHYNQGEWKYMDTTLGDGLDMGWEGVMDILEMKECERELLGGSVSSEEGFGGDFVGEIGERAENGREGGEGGDWDFLGKRSEGQVLKGVKMDRAEVEWVGRMVGCGKCKEVLEGFVGNFGFGKELLN